jgi:hypothetical protein
MINYFDCKDNIFFLTALFFSCLMGIGGMEAPEFRESEKQNRTAMYFFVQAGGKGNSIAGRHTYNKGRLLPVQQHVRKALSHSGERFAAGNRRRNRE